MIDHVGIYGSRVAEGLSAFNVGLVDTARSIDSSGLFFIYAAHKKFMNTSTSAESMASVILEGRYLENQTP